MTLPGEELVEIVDPSGVVERVVTRAEMRAGNLWHRNVAVFVQRTNGALVVHQRADWKDVYPSMWDLTFGGVPNVGEDDITAAARELVEEAGIVVAADELVDVGRRVEESERTRWVGRFFVVRTDAALHPADGEVQQMAEVAVADVPVWAAAHPLCPDVVPRLADLPTWLT